MKIYLASRYSRRVELNSYKETLEKMGHVVTSRWLNGSHQLTDKGTPIGDHGEKLVEEGTTEADKLRLKFANDDYDDVKAADLVICFTEPPRSDASRGGRHVELGLALAWNKEVIVIGHRENLFCYLEQIKFFRSFTHYIT